MRYRLAWLWFAPLIAAIWLAAYIWRAEVRGWMAGLTGEYEFLAQVRGLWQLTTDLLRPPLNLQPEASIANTGINPYGVNTFLQQEVEPAKRERQVQLIAAAGFHWLRQEFPWYDIEISAKGNFIDCRFPPCHSAWDKYDHIVELAERYGLEIIVRLSSPPAWSRADGLARGAFAPPDDFNDFADFAAAVAERYRGRLRYFQVGNEPNGNDEWGYQPVDPEAYTRLLCLTYERLKAVDPDNVVLAAALTPTASLGLDTGNGGTNLNDYIFLQRMYAAGAGKCFDIMSAQGYGLFSGPTDHRRRALIVNYGRHQFIRDIMVANGDAHKAIWIAEMNWNAAPPEVPAPFGRVTAARQAEYAPLAYQRAQAEWPWVGVIAFWYFKDADDHERGQPKYYFRLADPDFNLQPVYYALKEYMHRPAVMYPGWFQEDHWAVKWDANWVMTADPAATLGRVCRSTAVGATARFDFSGTDLLLEIRPCEPNSSWQNGLLTVQVDHNLYRLALPPPAVQSTRLIFPVVHGLSDGQHSAMITGESGCVAIDSFIVRRTPGRVPWLVAGVLVVLGMAWYAARRRGESPE